jgi:hypothetical protein
MRKAILFFGFWLGFLAFAQAQELNCEVTVNTEQLQQTADKRLFKEMRNQIFNFMNTTRWTNDVYKIEERVRCKLFITITSMPEIGHYKANVQVISSRPVYGTGYETVVLSHIDKDWDFEFSEATPLQFSENSFTSNLASLLSFYAYTIIGLDMDTYAKKGGSGMYDRAMTVLNFTAGQGQNKPGWKALDDNRNRNRYWLITNLQDQQIEPVRNAFYTYHREGLDIYATKADEARVNILASLRGIQQVARLKPGTAIQRDFFDAKADEIVNLMKGAAPADKQAVILLLSEVDPTNTGKYQGINQR